MIEESRPTTMALNWNNGAEGWQFPVLPSKVTIKRNGSGKDYRIVGDGPITTIEKPELAEISFESFFPAHEYPFANKIVHRNRDDSPNPNGYVNDINKWMHSGHPARFTYVGSSATSAETKIWIPVTFASFERWEEGGSPGDIFFSLKLKEYVFYAPRRVRTIEMPDGTKKQVEEPKERWDPRVPPTTYTLKPGDNLVRVSLRIYGDTDRWRDIMELNGITLDETKRLQVGRVLQLPPKK
jgi:nucleoid-associated protein YgaU